MLSPLLNYSLMLDGWRKDIAHGSRHRTLCSFPLATFISVEQHAFILLELFLWCLLSRVGLLRNMRLWSFLQDWREVTHLPFWFEGSFWLALINNSISTFTQINFLFLVAIVIILALLDIVCHHLLVNLFLLYKDVWSVFICDSPCASYCTTEHTHSMGSQIFMKCLAHLIVFRIFKIILSLAKWHVATELEHSYLCNLIISILLLL